MTTIATLAASLPTFRGSYAESFRAELAAGRQPNWSGSELRGEARKWGGSYARSRDAVITAVRRAGLERGLLVERIPLTRYGHGRIVVDVVEGPLTLAQSLAVV